MFASDSAAVHRGLSVSAVGPPPVTGYLAEGPPCTLKKSKSPSRSDARTFRERNGAGTAPCIFIGAFAHGPRTERFIYLVWAIVHGKLPVRMVGRIKLHLNHIKWASVKNAAGKKQPIRVTLALTDTKDKPVMASVRPNAAKWELL